jgi:RNA polymerase-binding transcription factor
MERILGMAKTDLRLLRQMFEAQLKEATSSKRLGDAIRIHQVADPVDMTKEAAERDLAMEILDRESVLLRRLRSAIDRINNGSYGLCLECEDEIAPKRLKAIPWAELCIRCQERADDPASGRDRMPAFEDQKKAA